MPFFKKSSSPYPSFNEIFETYAAFVMRTVRRMGVREADVEDVSQEVFIIVEQKLETYDPERSMRAWLFGIVRYRVSDYRKKVFRRAEMSCEDRRAAPAIEAGQEKKLSQKENRAILDRALDMLDEDKRAVFVLYQLEGLSMKEAAAMLGCPLQTAYSRLNAAREQVSFHVEQCLKPKRKEV
jgi:RNA polymerase sigma-70 factor, ECF subfamily